jgi:hypothetical protein
LQGVIFSPKKMFPYSKKIHLHLAREALPTLRIRGHNRETFIPYI